MQDEHFGVRAMTLCWRDDAVPPKEPDRDNNRDVVQTFMRTGRLPPMSDDEKKEAQAASLRLLNNFEW